MNNPLTDVLPAKARKVVYAALFVAALVFAAYQASGGDWKMFVGGLIVALTGATAASNTPASSSPADEGGGVSVGVCLAIVLGLALIAVYPPYVLTALIIAAIMAAQVILGRRHRSARDEGGSADVVLIYYILGIVFFVVATLNLLGVGTRGLFG